MRGEGSEQGHGITRSQFVSRSATAAAGLSLAGALAACGSDDGDGDRGTGGGSTIDIGDAKPGEIGIAQPDTGTPAKGGELVIGSISGGSGESFDPTLSSYTSAGYHMETMVYDKLTWINEDFQWEPHGAEVIEPNDDATEFKITPRAGITFHDGSPFTADDLLWSIKTWLNPANPNSGALSVVDARKVKKDGDSVVVPLTRAYAELPAIFAGIGCPIIKDGTKTFDKPVGTGPFKLTSFTPGDNSTYEAFAEHWDGAPNVDTARMVSLADDNAVLNALMSGQINMVLLVPYGRAKTLAKESDLRVYVGMNPSSECIGMRSDKPPFDDVRVRQAMRMIIDREAIKRTVFAGYAEIANDILGLGFPYYDEDIPQREPDIEQAKSLLAQAGAEDLAVTLETSNILPGFTGIAALFAEQAAQAGVTIKVKQVPPSDYYNTGAGYGRRIMGQDLWSLVAIPALYDNTLRSTAYANVTHWGSPEIDRKLDAAQAETDPAAAQALWSELMQLQYDEGSMIIPVAMLTLTAAAANIKNCPTTGLGWTSNPRAVTHVWIES